MVVQYEWCITRYHNRRHPSRRFVCNVSSCHMHLWCVLCVECVLCNQPCVTSHICRVCCIQVMKWASRERERWLTRSNKTLHWRLLIFKVINGLIVTQSRNTYYIWQEMHSVFTDQGYKREAVQSVSTPADELKRRGLVTAHRNEMKWSDCSCVFVWVVTSFLFWFRVWSVRVLCAIFVCHQATLTLRWFKFDNRVQICAFAILTCKLFRGRQISYFRNWRVGRMFWDEELRQSEFLRSWGPIFLNHDVSYERWARLVEIVSSKKALFV